MKTSISHGGVTIRLFSPAVAPASDLVEKRKERADTFLFALCSNPLFVLSQGANCVPVRLLLSETQRSKLPYLFEMHQRKKYNTLLSFPFRNDCSANLLEITLTANPGL